MISPSSSSDTFILGHVKHSSSTKEGELSKVGEKSNKKYIGKCTWHHCGKLEHTTNICRRKNGKKIP